MLLKDVPLQIQGTLIDVRTREEYDIGHVNNIELSPI